MRSSRFAPDRSAGRDDPLDPGPAGFAHRGLHGTGIPENSLAAFEAALALGAGIECDLRLSADGIPLLFHDRDAVRLCGVPLVLSQSRAEDACVLRLAGTTGTIPRLVELLDLVRGQVPLLLELKDERDAPRFASAVAGALEGYSGPVGVMSFAAGVGQWLRREAPSIRRGLVLSGRDSVLRRWSKMRRAVPQFLAVKTTELGQPWVHSARAAMPVYSWTVRSGEERRTARVQADAFIWEADGRP